MGKVNVSTALAMKLEQKLSYAQIAKLQGCSPAGVHKALRHLLPDEGTKTFQQHEADILSAVRLKVISQVDDRRLKKLSARDAIVSAAVLIDKERLLRGLSTSNVSVRVMTSELREIEAQLAALGE